jgi:hypothetical protein
VLRHGVDVGIMVHSYKMRIFKKIAVLSILAFNGGLISAAALCIKRLWISLF